MSHPERDTSQPGAQPSPKAGAGRYAIGPADLRADKDAIIDLTRRVLPDSPGEARYSKYYEGNPLGPPSVTVAREPGSERLVGMATLFPTRLRVNGESVPAAISADFAIDPDHRGFGPALALQRAAVESLGELGLVCAFGCPNPFSEPVVARVGFAEVGQLTRYVKVLRGRLAVDLFVHNGALARLLSGVSAVTVDPLMPLVFRERRARGSKEFSVERPTAFDDRFAGLWEATGRRHTVSGERTPEVLNWKYELGDGAPGDYRVFAIVDGAGQVAGYIVYRTKEGVRHVFDIASVDSPAAVDALVSEFLADARGDGAIGVTYLYLGSDELIGPRLRSFGFLTRTEDKRLRVCLPQDRAPAVNILDPASWHYLIGDDDF